MSQRDFKNSYHLVKFFPKDFCEEPEKNEDFKKDMDAINAEIKEKLEKFNGKKGSTPEDSSPFFFSMQAYKYSGIEANLPNADLQGNDVSL